MIKVALPKGRMGDKVYAMFESIGYACKEIKEDNRKLVFVSDNEQVSYVLVKPSDVSIYVERGAVDIGVVGKDVMLETSPDVYEILDLKLGKCRMCVAGRNGFVEDASLPLRVATKYPNIAKKYYGSLGRQIDVIELHGSIELAPILDMSDVIVDIVETGKTLKENNLGVFTTIAHSSARLVANKSAYNICGEQIKSIADKLASVTKGE